MQAVKKIAFGIALVGILAGIRATTLRRAQLIIKNPHDATITTVASGLMRPLSIKSTSTNGNKIISLTKAIRSYRITTKINDKEHVYNLEVKKLDHPEYTITVQKNGSLEFDKETWNNNILIKELKE